MLNILFFQNCVSPHQMPYIEALAESPQVEYVAVIAPSATLQERKAMGWGESGAPVSPKLEVYVAPTDTEVEVLLSKADAALFSGFSAFPALVPWLKMSLRYPVRRGCITEAPLTYSVEGNTHKPLWMHRVKFLLKDYRYAKHFDWVFAIGPDAVSYFSSWHLHWQVVPFLYCPRVSEPELSVMPPICLRMLYCGALSVRKDVMTLLRALSSADFDYQLTIIGDGTERSKLCAYATQRKMPVNFIGSLPMEQCQQQMAAHDLLVLPSIHDGWGAVINEAMAVGTLVCCSDQCGARQLIQESGYGRVFASGDERQLNVLLTDIAQRLQEVRRQREERRRWAQKHISPKAVAQRMLDRLCEYSSSSQA